MEAERMREFLKFVVAIIVITVIICTIYFFLTNNAKYQVDNPNIKDNIVQEDTVLEIKSGEEEKEEFSDIFDEKEQHNVGDDKSLASVNIPQGSEENANGNIEDLSGENILIENLDEKLARINLIETKNNLSNLTKSLNDELGINVMGMKNREYFESIPQEKIDVVVQVAGSMVYIIPMPDFLDNAQYHYDANGKLVLYVCELAGIGGEIRYYFENDILLTQVINVEEVQLGYENAEEIIERSKLIYNNYMK